jgi:hypothetical protein
MMQLQTRSLGYYAASHWLQGAVLLAVLALIFTGLMSALNDAAERAERQGVELTIRNMRTGLKLAMGEVMMQQREGEMAAWVGSNPVRWLGSPPAGYRGECSAEESRNLSGGEWCFEGGRRELVYRPHHPDHLHPLPAGSERQCSHLSWRVARAPESVVSAGFVGLRLEAAAPCQWVLERR